MIREPELELQDDVIAPLQDHAGLLTVLYERLLNDKAEAETTRAFATAVTGVYHLLDRLEKADVRLVAGRDDPDDPDGPGEYTVFDRDGLAAVEEPIRAALGVLGLAIATMHRGATLAGAAYANVQEALNAAETLLRAARTAIPESPVARVSQTAGAR